MRKVFILLSMVTILVSAQDMVVRVYAESWTELKRISDKPLDIAAARAGEWFDLVTDQAGLDRIAASGLAYEIIIPSLEREKQKYRGSYLSYSQIRDSLQHLAQNYPALCKFDSLPIRTYENRALPYVKISDNVAVEENEPRFSLDGCHHSREWATPQACLFFADSMLRSYASVPSIQEIINTTEIYVFPLINVDGYVYDYPGQLSWRKNREPFGGAIGTDCNRNYGGACNGEAAGYWGAADEGQCEHLPSGQTFPGAYAFSGNEIQAYTSFIRSRNVTTGISLHSYGEQLMWPWSYKGQAPPDSALYVSKGNYMASQMQRLGGGTYTPGQGYVNPYPTSGGARDWVYGFNHWVNGLSCLFYGSEIGTAFYQPQADLDNISRQVFKAAKYLAGFADSLIIVADGMVAPPAVNPRDSINPTFVLSWHPRNAYDNNPNRWELVELSGPVVKTDSLESGTTRWILTGYSLSTTQAHSATHSLWSGDTADQNTTARTVHPYLVRSGDSLTFWCYYNLENNYDVTVVEVSEDGLEWFNADTMRFTGTQTTWQRRAYSLAPWVGKSVYFQFRTMYDASTQSGGFFVDDIRPVNYFTTVNVVSSNITDTLYQFNNHPLGEYYFYVRGNNTAWGWGAFSGLRRVIVTNIGVAEQEAGSAKPFLSVSPNPCRKEVRFTVQKPRSSDQNYRLAIYNITGRLIRDLSADLALTGNIRVTVLRWDGTDQNGSPMPAGVYFVRLEMPATALTEKVILTR